MVDQLVPGQVEALYVILQAMLTGSVTTNQPEPPDDAPRRHRFSFVATLDAEPDLAARSARILREELGDRP
jgi:hypothetical protein